MLPGFSQEVVKDNRKDCSSSGYKVYTELSSRHTSLVRLRRRAFHMSIIPPIHSQRKGRTRRVAISTTKSRYSGTRHLGGPGSDTRHVYDHASQQPTVVTTPNATVSNNPSHKPYTLPRIQTDFFRIRAG
eukprot:GHVQ01022815.1.p1 GENE.GHVQ01022815.1~~GHVQ01022815.1.p1  ORF type:complete len:130 (+),score=4.51 GHVQ01022815.1:807-1196(+)